MQWPFEMALHAVTERHILNTGAAAHLAVAAVTVHDCATGGPLARAEGPLGCPPPACPPSSCPPWSSCGWRRGAVSWPPSPPPPRPRRRVDLHRRQRSGRAAAAPRRGAAAGGDGSGGGGGGATVLGARRCGAAIERAAVESVAA